ncbi:unnamed protein product [Prorocentrum cordatum]|uniref:Uncharacterized protein n=1 Tax=Prorocentrum cordatum TaxID=2364126 RepID=A0ABN9VXG3_9DINO|nr:unnamed protein product [Polarella glacialis]
MQDTSGKRSEAISGRKSCGQGRVPKARHRQADSETEEKGGRTEAGEMGIQGRERGGKSKRGAQRMAANVQEPEQCRTESLQGCRNWCRGSQFPGKTATKTRHGR